MADLFNVHDAASEARLVVCPIGKHRGATLGWIIEHDPGYFAWMLRNVRFDVPRVRDAVRVLELAYGADLQRAANQEAVLRR